MIYKALEGLVIKLYEKEALAKSFALFFVTMELFLLFIFYHYHHVEQNHINERIFLEMKNYSISFDDDRFDMDIVPIVDDAHMYELYFDKESLYILIPFAQDDNSSMQIKYSIASYDQQIYNMEKKLAFEAMIFSLIALFVSMAFAFYTINPMRKAMILLEEFIRDIIHDLNTPITSILINLKMMKRDEEITSIEQSAKNISMLHKNLDTYLKDEELTKELVDIGEILEELIGSFCTTYDYLDWQIDASKNCMVECNKNAIYRIIHNLISNACKHNTSNGFVKISLNQTSLEISNDSYGLKNPSKVFDRFYKESSRGIGIGLHIVDKLCKEMGIGKEVRVDGNIVYFTIRF